MTNPRPDVRVSERRTSVFIFAYERTRRCGSRIACRAILLSLRHGMGVTSRTDFGIFGRTAQRPTETISGTRSYASEDLEEVERVPFGSQ